MTKEQLSGMLIKIKNPLLLILIGVSFLLCGLTLHDVQTNQGVGLYLSLQLGQDNVALFNLLVDCMGILLLFTALILPCMALKRINPGSFFCLFSLYLALVPDVRPANLVHLGNTLANLTTRQIFSAENPPAALLGSLSDVALLFRTVLPLLLILVWTNRNTAPEKLQKWQIGLIVAEVFFIVLNILFPDISGETAYFMNYLLVVWCFAEWEKICDRFPKFGSWGMILLGGCWLSGLYRMIELMSIVKF